MSGLVISLLGPYWVTLNDVPLTLTLATDKVRALLAYLAVESQRPQRRDTLAALLWPGSPSAAAHTSLRQALYRLRRAISDHRAPDSPLLITAKDMQFNPSSGYWLDVAEFEARISAGRACHLRGPNLCSDCVADLTAAVELYRGDFMAGLALPACPRFEWWQLTMQESCQRQALEALHRLVVYYEAQGDYASVSRCAERQIELEPWRESAYRRCMRALALSGQPGEAVHQYEICRREMAQEMGMEPSAETTHLCQQIRSGTLPKSTPPERNAGSTPSQAAQGQCRLWAGVRLCG